MTEQTTTPVWQLSIADDTGSPVTDRAIAVAVLAQLAGRPATQVAPLVSDPDGGSDWGVWVAPLYGEQAEQAEAALDDPDASEAAWYVQLPGDDGGFWVAVPLP